MLWHPDHDQPFELEVDASQYALGAILYQRNDGGKLQAVGYYPQTLNLAECNYDVYDWELLAVIRTLTYWRHLLLGAKHQVVVWTDHNNLTFYRHPQTISSRVACYIPRMAEYDLVLKHKPGTLNRADYLSRPLGVDRSVKNNENVMVLPNQLFARALNLEDLDQEVRQLQGKLSEEWKEQYGLIDAEEGWTRQGQLAMGDIPELHRCLTAAHHDHATAGHLGIQRTISLIS